MTKHVIVVSADFPPSGYPPALRTKLFCQHLEEFGWKPTVVTVREEDYEWPVDPENKHLLSSTLRVVRVRAVPVRLTRRIGIGDLGLRSLWPLYLKVKQLCQDEAVDLLFISIPPYFPAIIGRLIYEKFKIPYVIDYIDPWGRASNGSVFSGRSSKKAMLSHALSLLLEPFALRHVSHLVGVSKGTTDLVVTRYPWLNRVEATEIPYGGEPADFDYLRHHGRKNKFFVQDDGFFHISYVGRGGDDLAPGFTALFRAVKKGLEEGIEFFTRLRFHFIGTSYDSRGNGRCLISGLASDCGLNGIVKEEPHRVPYLDALQILLDSQALLAIGSAAPHYTASKIFPYLLAQKPLLALFHEASNVVQILGELKVGKLITFSSVRPPENEIKSIYEWLKALGTPATSPSAAVDSGEFEGYSARAMAGRLATVFEKVSNQGRD